MRRIAAILLYFFGIHTLMNHEGLHGMTLLIDSPQWPMFIMILCGCIMIYKSQEKNQTRALRHMRQWILFSGAIVTLFEIIRALIMPANRQIESELAAFHHDLSQLPLALCLPTYGIALIPFFTAGLLAGFVYLQECHIRSRA